MLLGTRLLVPPELDLDCKIPPKMGSKIGRKSISRRSLARSRLQRKFWRLRRRLQAHFQVSEKSFLLYFLAKQTNSLSYLRATAVAPCGPQSGPSRPSNLMILALILWNVCTPTKHTRVININDNSDPYWSRLLLWVVTEKRFAISLLLVFRYAFTQHRCFESSWPSPPAATLTCACICTGAH